MKKMARLSREQLARWAEEREAFREYWHRRYARLRAQEERLERRRLLMRRMLPPLRLLDR
jgi:cephalosporin-C deacetylase-like acetyl esterase